MNLKLSLLSCAILTAIFPASTTFASETAATADTQSTNTTEVITVSGDFAKQSLQRTPASIAVVTQEMIRQRNAQHLEDILNTTANVNFSSGASHARFFQVRGIGERSQFVDSVNPSVGVTIDGIDYSGIGTGAALFDIEQVEVFRGPQGTRFGANAMAGMINLNSTAANGDQEGKIQLSVANYNSQQIAIAHGTAISNTLSYRMSLQKLSSDGFINNRFLNRDDTNGTDEYGGRLNVHWIASENTQVDWATHYYELDNGYDAFSLDNTRETLSDQPGFDKQRTKATSVTTHYSGFVSADLSFQASINYSDLGYGYDEDWTHTNFDPWEYSSFDHYYRDHDTSAFDLRATAKAGSTANWVVGIYRNNKEIELNRLATYGFTPVFDSHLGTHNNAFYGQRDWQFDDKVTLTTGLRVEQQSTYYHDSVNTVQSISETLWGGKINLSYQVTNDTMLYTSLSRGYKAGGVNGEAIGKALVDGQDTSAAFLVKRTTFEPEILHNLEFGVKGSNAEDDLSVRMNIFYSDRDKIQLKGYVTEPGSDGSATLFTGYIENGASGSNYGLETEINYQVNPSLAVFANLGLLRTEVKDFIAEDGTDMNGREQAHAPRYQYSIGAVYELNQQWSVRANAEGKDEFYYSMSHNAQSSPVNLVNLAISYQTESWDLSLWGRNVFDKEYGVRGFYFGNDPRDQYTAKTYTQLGEPARFGLTTNYHF